MRLYSTLTILCLFTRVISFAQAPALTNDANAIPAKENIYEIKNNFLMHVLHNPTDKEKDENDNDLARFNRWYNFVAPRCYPTGDMPRPNILIEETRKAVSGRKLSASRSTSATNVWQPVGPMQVPTNNNGIGRINCIVIDPLDTNTLYVGSACGGVHISHNGGLTWASNSDYFPSLSIADIAVNTVHTDTLYAATGDGYGYVDDGYNTFWGGLYSAGVMKSTDGGNTWDTTGLSFVQSNRDIVQKLLINPHNPNILLAAATNGIWQTTNAGFSWTHVYTADHVYSMAFYPGSPDTVYGVNNSSLIVSYNGGTTWSTLHAGINPAADRASIAVSPVAPSSIWLLDANDSLHWSHNGGVTFYTVASPASTANFYGYYDRVLVVSPTDSLYVLAFGMIMAKSTDGATTWAHLNPAGDVHVDNHAAAINPLHSATMYTGNDGGISITRNGGATWKNLSNGLMISQIYRMSSSRQNPDTMICGLQDNGSITYNATNWNWVTGGDGQACAIDPLDDNVQISSSQNGYFNLSTDAGNTFNYLNINDTGTWTAPVAFDPNNTQNIFFGFNHIWATYDQGTTFTQISGELFAAVGGASFLVVAPSNSQVLYASDQSTIYRTTDGGVTWTNVTGSLASSSVAITRIAVDPRDEKRVFVTTSGYVAGRKVFLSTVGGTTWTNISQNLPNLPADCIAIDTSTAGALFVGTDIGVYYTDSSQTGWSLYQTGLPNVIVDDLDVNYGNYMVRAATYGRGVWQCGLKKQPLSIPKVSTSPAAGVKVYPNPTSNTWNLQFLKQKPANFVVKVSDISGRTVYTQENAYQIDASQLASGVYNIEVVVGDAHYNLKAIRK